MELCKDTIFCFMQQKPQNYNVLVKTMICVCENFHWNDHGSYRCSVAHSSPKDLSPRLTECWGIFSVAKTEIQVVKMSERFSFSLLLQVWNIFFFFLNAVSFFSLSFAQLRLCGRTFSSYLTHYYTISGCAQWNR